MEERSPLIQAEFANNPEPRVSCALLLDTSSSMLGPPIEALNHALDTFKSELSKDPIASKRTEVAVLTFDSEVKVIRDFVTVDNFQPPRLTAQGVTHMGSGITRALELVENRKMIYRANGISYYRPWVIMITDGEPQGEPDYLVEDAGRMIKERESERSVAFFAVGVAGANMHRLEQIVQVRKPQMLNGLNFGGFFQWLSNSMQVISNSKTDDDQIPLPSVSGWSML